MQKIILLLFLSSWSLTLLAQQSQNMELAGEYNRGDGRYSGSWTYVGPDGSEYALLGALTGTAAYAIDDEITELGFVPGPESRWREITVIGDHAFVTTEGNSPNTGMQVIDLSHLPDSISLVTTYTETFNRGHIIQRDMYSDAPYVYVSGTTTTEGVHILDISDPANPVEVGLYRPNYYIHDCHVKGDRMYAAAFYESKIDIVDISDKTNPVLLAQVTDPGTNTHSFWTTEDDRFLIVCDEEDGYPARIFNIEDIHNPEEVATYTANETSLVHNPYVRGDYVFFTHNTEGIRVVDIADPTLPVEVGYFDTFDGPSGGFSGLWSACPFLPSGKIIGGNREDGLKVWEFNNARAGRIFGTVIDSISGEPLYGVQVEVWETGEVMYTDFEGKFKFGSLPGDFTVEINPLDYHPRVIPVRIEAGSSDDFLFKMVPASGVAVSEVNESSKLKTFPNPFHDYTSVDLSDLKGKPNHAQIFNEEGNLLREFSVKGESSVNIDRKDLPSGTLILVLSDKKGDTIATRRIIAQ